MTTTATDQRPHTAYRHEAVLYRGDDGFLEAVLPFVREGLEAGQPVLVAVPSPRLAVLADALGHDADRVGLVDMVELGANPARIIPAWAAFLADQGAGGRPVRGIGEPVWAGRRADELLECQLHEALLNLAVDPDAPLWLRCPYDVDALPPSVLAEAGHSHPILVDGDVLRGSPAYRGQPHAFAALAQRLPSAPAQARCLDFGLAQLGEVRRLVTQRAVVAGLPADVVDDLVYAVNELASNSIEHGGGSGRLAVWQTDEAFACEVSDRGRLADPLAGRRRPGTTGEGGRGLWIVNNLCDLVQVRTSELGTSVRLLTWI